MLRFLNNGLQGREALLIDPAKATDAKALAEKYAFTDVLAKLFGDRPQAYVRADGIGVIPVMGVIGKGVSPLERMMGAADIDQISADIDAMEADPAVKRIAFHVISPGGTVTGVPELASKMRRISKPTRSFGEEANSAALWIAAAADSFVALPSGSIGSVGVYMVIPDYSQAYADAGVRMVVIKSSRSPLKGAGIEGTSLTAEQIADLQKQVDAIDEDFIESIKMTRVNAKDAAFTGGSFSGKEAAKLGLVTGLADSLEEALKTWA
jgi:ClpP class serine protease